MTRDDELRQRIIDVAAALFAENGYGGTRLRMVAERAEVSPRTVRRLTGGRNQLFAKVIATKLTSEAADRVAAAAAGEATPPLAALLEAAGQIFAAPQRSWSVLELEALTRANRDDEVRAIEAARLQRRSANMKTVTEQIRWSGGIDDSVDDDALVHFALALSVGLAVVDRVAARHPSQANWNALMARLGAAIAPTELLLANGEEPRRPWRLRVDIPDRPGGLARLIRVLNTLHVYVVATAVLASREGVRTIDLAVTVPEKVSAQTLLAATMATGNNGHVTEGSAEDGLDLPTRVLDGAAELVTNPGFAPMAAAALVEADRFEIANATEGEDDAANILRLQWTADRHVVLHRDWAPFAAAEKARASALLRLAAAIASIEGDADALGWIQSTKRNGTVWIRLARPEDTDAVAAMHERCSDLSRYRRYLTGISDWRELSLRQLTGGHRGATLVAMSEEGAIVGLGNVFPDTSSEGHAAEVALIVEDAHQNRGIGTSLLRHLLELAERLGFKEVVATVLAENAGMLRILQATRLDWSRDGNDGVYTLRAPLPDMESGTLAPAHPSTTRIS